MDWMLQLDLIWNWLVTNGRVQWPWRILDIILSNYQCDEYTFFWMVQEFPYRRRCFLLVIWAIHLHVCLCSTRTPSLMCSVVCRKRALFFKTLAFSESFLREDELPRSRTPNAIFSAHATDQTKELVKDKYSVKNKMTNEITECWIKFPRFI